MPFISKGSFSRVPFIHNFMKAKKFFIKIESFDFLKVFGEKAVVDSVGRLLHSFAP